MNKQHGFTLIELLVVIAILSVLVAVAVPNIIRFQDMGKVEAANTELASLQTAVAAYMVENNGSIPTVEQASIYLSGEVRGSYGINSKTGAITCIEWLPGPGVVEPSSDGTRWVKAES